MRSVYKTLLLGVLATATLAGICGLIAYGTGIDPKLGGLVIALGAVGTGLIGGEVARRTSPRPPRRNR
jgi:hypothetical protein